MLARTPSPLQCLLLAAGLSTFAQAAAAQEAARVARIAPPEPIATVEYADGATLEFHEVEPGVVLAVERGTVGQTPRLARLSIERDTTPLQVFRALAPRATPPRALRRPLRAAPEPEEPPEDRDAADVLDSGEEADLGRLAAPARPTPPPAQGRPVIQAVPAAPPPRQPVQPNAEPEPDADDTGQAVPAEPPDTSPTRAEWFQKELCPAASGRDVPWCWVNRSGRSRAEVWSVGILATVYSCGGTTRFAVAKKRLGKWKRYGSWDVLPGQYLTFRWLGVPRTRASVAEGTCHHHGGVGIKL